MPFDWDEAKNEANFRKHGIYFEAAEEVFSDEVLTVADTRHDYGEPRYTSLGGAVIGHTPRGEGTRIISMRKANERERKTYQAFLAKARRLSG